MHNVEYESKSNHIAVPTRIIYALHNQTNILARILLAASTLISKDVHNFFIESYLARKAASTLISKDMHNP